MIIMWSDQRHGIDRFDAGTERENIVVRAFYEARVDLMFEVNYVFV